MPPEPVPWDRKDVFRQRKHERSEPSLGSAFRWRDSSTTSSSSHYAPREFSRWGSGEYRRLPGHGKHGGWHHFSEETGHGNGLSRSSNRMFEDENYRPTASRGEWRYNRSSRDNRVSFSQRDWKSHAWEVNNGSSSSLGKPRDVNNDHRSVDDRPSHLTDPHSGLVNLWDQSRSQDQQDNKVCALGKPCDVNFDQSSADEKVSLPSNPHSDLGNSCDQAQSMDQHDNKACSPRRTYDANNDQRPVDSCSSHPLHAHSDLVSACDQFHSKDQHYRVCDINGLNTVKQCERENSLGSIDWKHLRWSRSGSLSSRGSGFCHSSSSKSLGTVDSSEVKTELLPKNVTPIQSPSGDAAACITSAAPSEEMTSRKKPRLGWGEGLAKYEKKNVEGPDLNANKDGNAVSANSAEEVHSLGTNSVDKSPIALGSLNCASPATPSSVACSFSPGTEDKPFGKAANAEIDLSNPCSTTSLVSHNYLEGFPFNLENLDNISIVNLGYLLNELVHSDYPGSVDSKFVCSTPMNKLLVWKADILKALEVTESEIDLLENEYKALKSESGSFCSHLAASSSFPGVDKKNLSEEQEAAYSLVSQPAPSQIDSSVAGTIEKRAVASAVLDGDVDSPVIATSKLSEQPYLVKANPLSHFARHVESTWNMAGIQSIETIPSSNEVHVFPCGDNRLLVKGEVVELSSSDCCKASDGVEILCDMIFASNKESASEASKVFNKLLPRILGHVDNSGLPNISCRQDDPLIRNEVAARRRLLRFKETILALKFKAFQHQWKKDTRLLLIRKYPSKSRRKYESSLHRKHGGLQKHQSSICLKFYSPAGNQSLVPTTDLVNFTGNLLSDSQLKLHRDILKMPALILDEKEKVTSRFISTSGLVEDPFAVEKERTMINPWTSEEKEIFLDELATYGKDFSKIASFLSHKTTADCIEFYYKNHKSAYFEKTKKKLDGKQGKCTYMVARGKKWNREINAASLDILGAVSLMAANARRVAANRSSKFDDGSFIERTCNIDLPGKETVAADVLAGICGTLSSEAISSCITSSVDPGEGYRDWKYPELVATVKESQMSDITQNDGNGDDDDDDTCSEESCDQMGPLHWTDEERSAFMQAFSTYGRDFAIISQCVGTRSPDQCRVFFSKVRKCLGLDSVHSLSGKVSTSLGDDANGDGSDMEDASVLETSSVICNDELETKRDGTLPASPANTNQEEYDHSGPVKLKTGLNRSEQENVIVLSCLKEAAELMDSNACHIGDKVELVAQNELVDCDDKRDPPETGLGASVSVMVSSGPSSSSKTTIQSNAVAERFAKRSRKDSEGHTHLSPTTKLNNRCSLMQDINITRNPTHQAEDTTSFGFSFSGCLHQVPIQVSMDAIPLPQKRSSAFSNHKSPDSHVFQVEEKPNQDRLLSSLDLQEGDKCHTSVGWADHNQNGLSRPLVDNIGSFQIPWGSSLQIPTRKEMNRDIGYGKPTETQSRLKSDVCITNSHLGQDFALRKCSSLKTNGSTGKHQGLSHKEHKSGHKRSHSFSLSDTVKPRRNDNVKLFGTIITSHENEGKEIDYPRQTGKSSTQKMATHHNGNGTPNITAFDHMNQLGLQNVPITSYGFWDGNRIRTGFSSLPDSATLLANYPAAFGNYSTSSSAFEQQASQSVAKSDGSHPNDLSVYAHREMNFQANADHNGSRVQQFDVDTKQQRDIFSEMESQNGFETTSSSQELRRGMEENHGVGNVISDPVAAIRLHYAKTDAVWCPKWEHHQRRALEM